MFDISQLDMLDSLVVATWGLVLVTALLVAASTVPVILEQWKRRNLLATKFVPDMHILNGRIDGRVESLLEPSRLTVKALEGIAESTHRDLELISNLIEVRDGGLKLMNELYICRHLVTYASEDLDGAAEIGNSHDETTVRRRDSMILRACQAYRAARITLQQAESLLPKSTTLIDGEAFWDRFARVSDEREKEAARLLADEKQRDRTRSRRPDPL